MFFTISTPMERPMSRREMDQLLRTWEKDLYEEKQQRTARTSDNQHRLNARVGRVCFAENA